MDDGGAAAEAPGGAAAACVVRKRRALWNKAPVGSDEKKLQDFVEGIPKGRSRRSKVSDRQQIEGDGLGHTVDLDQVDDNEKKNAHAQRHKKRKFALSCTSSAVEPNPSLGLPNTNTATMTPIITSQIPPISTPIPSPPPLTTPVFTPISQKEQSFQHLAPSEELETPKPHTSMSPTLPLRSLYRPPVTPTMIAPAILRRRSCQWTTVGTTAQQIPLPLTQTIVDPTLHQQTPVPQTIPEATLHRQTTTPLTPTTPSPASHTQTISNHEQMQIRQLPQSQTTTHSVAEPEHSPQSQTSFVGSSHAPDATIQEPGSLDTTIYELDSGSGPGPVPVNLYLAGSRKKKGRGMAVCKQLQKLPSGQRIKVVVEPGGFVIKNNIFTSRLGQLVRSIVPIHYIHWKDVDSSYKDLVVREHGNTFDWGDNPNVPKWILMAASKMHRSFRDVNWRKFCKSEPDKDGKAEVLPYEQSLRNRPNHIPPDHWKRFLDARYSVEAEIESKRNTKNRAKGAPATHNQGRRNMENLKQLLMETNGGKEPSRVDLFESTKSKFKKDGSREWLHPSYADNFGKMNDLKRDGRDDEEAFREVMGDEHPGSVRCAGPSHTMTSWYGGQKRGDKLLVTAQCQRLSSEVLSLKAQLKVKAEEEEKRREEEDKERKQTQEELQILRAQMTQILQLMSKPSDDSLPLLPPPRHDDNGGVTGSTGIATGG